MIRTAWVVLRIQNPGNSLDIHEVCTLQDAIECEAYYANNPYVTVTYMLDPEGELV